jgi:predicted permease
MMKLLRRLRYWFHSRRIESELSEEIEFHRALKQEQLESSGMSAKDAAAASRRELGNTLRAREDSREVWRWIWFDDAIRDVAYACRSLLRMKTLAVVVIASLGIGIGVNTAVFSWIQMLVFQPLPGVKNASSFYLVQPKSEVGSYPDSSWPEYNDLRKRLTSFRELLAFRSAPLNVGDGDQTERRYGLLVSDNYFSELGLRPIIGRLFDTNEAVERKLVAILSYSYWKGQFNGDPDVVGRGLRINDKLVTIIGVLPEGFQGTVLGLDFDLWMPAKLAPDLFVGSRELEERGERGYTVMGRLQSGVTAVQAQNEATLAMRELARLYPDSNLKFDAEVLPFWRMPKGAQRFLLPGLEILQAVMLVLLLAVCGNTANLLLARATARSREIGTRLAIGASRWRVVRLLMTESLVLGLFGAALGIGFAFWGTQALRDFRMSMAFPIRFQSHVDATGMLIAILLGVSCAIVFGVAPAFQLVRGDPQAKMRATLSTVPRKRFRNALIGIEAGLAMLVLLAAGLFLESFRETRTVDPGFQVEGVSLSVYDLTGGSAGHFQANRKIDPAVSRDFADRLLGRLQALPGVEAAAIASYVPLDIHGMPLVAFTIEGMSAPDARPERSLVNFVTPDYFRTMKIPLLHGGGFTDLNDKQTPPQVVVNQQFVRKYLQETEPVGHRLKSRNNAFVIAGVVKDSFYDAFGESPLPIIYFSYRESPRASGEIHLRTRPGTESIVGSEVQRAARDIQPGLPIFNVRTMTDHLNTNLFLRRIPARLFTVLGPLLLLFAAIGIYSVVDYNVAQRQTEIGVRIALGATGRDVVRQIIGETMKVIGWGVFVGALIAFVVYIHVVPGGPLDPRVFLGVPAILLLVATIACWLPARRTVALDAMVALRSE